MPIPPSNSCNFICLVLTSLEIVTERKCVEYPEPFLSPTGKAALILVESDVEYLVFGSHNYLYYNLLQAQLIMVNNKNR